MSEVGRTADAGWQIGVSKAVAYPVAEVWEFLVSREGVEIWLGPCPELPREKGATYETANGTAGKIRSFREQDRVRLTWRPKDWEHDSTLQVAVSGTASKTTLHFHQEWLNSHQEWLNSHQEWLSGAEERELQRTYWKDVAERLVTALDER
jgi:activator of HSP90 ATPase